MDLDILIEEVNNIIISTGQGFENLYINDLTHTEQSDIMKYRPDKSLIIYGTLAPNRPNHSKIEHINGKWTKGLIKGKLVKEGWGVELGYFGFRHASPEEQENIEAYILFSDELADNWTYLDEFEGDGYRRILARFELDTGEVGVGNIYAINQSKMVI